MTSTNNHSMKKPRHCGIILVNCTSDWLDREVVSVALTMFLHIWFAFTLRHWDPQITIKEIIKRKLKKLQVPTTEESIGFLPVRQNCMIVLCLSFNFPSIYLYKICNANFSCSCSIKVLITAISVHFGVVVTMLLLFLSSVIFLHCITLMFSRQHTLMLAVLFNILTMIWQLNFLYLNYI